MKKFEIKGQHIVIFLVSLVCISQELFLTRILNLKAWNHVVYTVIPFAMLGYGIGANIVLVFNDFLKKFQKERLLAVFLLLIALTTVGTAFLLKDIPIRVEYILSIFVNASRRDAPAGIYHFHGAVCVDRLSYCLFIFQ